MTQAATAQTTTDQTGNTEDRDMTQTATAQTTTTDRNIGNTEGRDMINGGTYISTYLDTVSAADAIEDERFPILTLHPDGHSLREWVEQSADARCDRVQVELPEGWDWAAGSEPRLQIATRWRAVFHDETEGVNDGDLGDEYYDYPPGPKDLFSDIEEEYARDGGVDRTRYIRAIIRDQWTGAESEQWCTVEPRLDRVSPSNGHGNAKLTEQVVRKMRRLREEWNLTYAEIGRRVGVSRQQAWSVCKRLNWRHVS